tara:strand:+ start:2282 stop:3688 length:1407 start_codon:yes stop_codon:yes gene_type:complete
MVKQIITILLILNIYTLAKSQSVNIIKEYNDWKVATDMVISNTGFVYVCGNSGGEPMLIKLDTNGNEQWIKYYPQTKSGYSFTRMILDSNENIYLHGTKSGTFKNFTSKLDSEGNEKWVNHAVSGFYYGPVNTPVNMMIHNDELSVIHNNTSTSRPPNDTLVISQFSMTNGNLNNYVEILDMVDKYLPRNSPPPFKGGNWILSGFSGVLEVSPYGSYSYQEMGDSIPGILCAAKKSGGYITYETKQFKNVNGFEEWGTTLFWYDEFWNDTNAVIISRYNPILTDTISLVAFEIETILNKGLIVAGNFHSKSDTSLYGNTYFSQVNPDNGETMWDTVTSEAGGITNMAINKSTVIALEGLGLSNTGIRLYKINLPNISYQTEFITSINSKVLAHNQETKIYPNPSSSYFEVTSIEKIKSIKVFMINGILLSTHEVNNQSYQVDITQSGVYILEIENENGGIEYQKLVKW